MAAVLLNESLFVLAFALALLLLLPVVLLILSFNDEPV